VRKPNVLNLAIHTTVRKIVPAGGEYRPMYEAVAKARITPFGLFESAALGETPHAARKLAQAQIFGAVGAAFQDSGLAQNRRTP